MTQPNPDAILGTYADFKVIRTRKALQVVVEVPLEDFEHVTALLGPPMPASEIPVVIARLQPEAIQRASGASLGASQTARVASAPKERREWSSLPPSQRAALLCKDEGFQRMMGADSEERANVRIKEYLGIDSKTELDSRPSRREEYERLERDYFASKGRPPLEAYL